ncbi:MAG TPA: NAD(P)-binding domain-containing protein [Acidimicrobiales bacterium]|nr:NAD(P)-binding domain-containing protein [Acidimicrobiales bacterium]
MTLLISIEEQREILAMSDVMDALDLLYRAEARGEAASRARSDIVCSCGDATYGLKSMDGVFPAVGVAAVRIDSDVVGWPEVGGQRRRVKVPAAPGGRWVGLVLLFSTITGEPLAIFPDGYAQRMRVGATSALAVREMARRDAAVLGIIGSGWQAGAQLLGATRVRRFDSVVAYSPNPSNVARFAEEMGAESGLEVQPRSSVEEVVEVADVVLCATNSLAPVLRGATVRPGQHFGCIRDCELDDALYRAADRVVLHTRALAPEHIRLGGRAAPPDGAAEGWGPPSSAVDWPSLPVLAEVIGGSVDGRSTESEVTCFVNNMGSGAQFAAVGARLVDLARAHGAGRELPTEWFTQDVRP